MRKTELIPAQVSSDDLFELRTVCRVAETGAFSAAARALGVSVSTVTRAVQRVEARLGVKLFLRSTHGLAATEAGRSYTAHLARFLSEEQALREQLATSREAGHGTLRVTLPVFVAERVLPEVVARFHRAHPSAVLDVHASDDRRDVVRESFDLAIRQGPLPDSTLRGRRVASFRRVVCASPAFLERYGVPERPSELARLPCLLYGNGAGNVHWSFRRSGGPAQNVRVRGPVRSNNLDLLAALALAGLGVIRLPDWAVRDAVRQGRLHEILASYSRTRESVSLFAVHVADPGKDRLRRTFLSLLEEATRAPYGR